MATIMTTTNAIFLPPLGVEPSSSDANNSSGRVVRFESACVLIPDTEPRRLSRSYSLPLWKKKPIQLSDSEAEPSLHLPDTHVVLKVPIPRFISKASISRSPSRGRSSGSPQGLKPLSPCLVHRSPSSSPTLPYKPVRRTSQPISTQERKHDSAVTIPLRECCPDCAPITEESFMEGDRWTEKFSRAARRRRSASLDNTGFSTQHNKTSVFSITVDEVDKRRKSMDNVGEDLKRSRQPPISPLNVAPSIQPRSSKTPPLQDTSLLPIPSTSSSSEISSGDLPTRANSSPIQEEDEDQLFPLPSPRRSPTSSKASSPVPSPKPSPFPSPNVSATSLSSIPPPVPKYIGITSSTSSQGKVLPKSISRKTPQARDIHWPHDPNQAPVLPPLSISKGFSAAFDWGSHDPSLLASRSRKPRPKPLILTATTKTLGLSVPTSQSRTQISSIRESTRERRVPLTANTKPLPTVPLEYTRSHYNPPLPSPPWTPSSPTPPRSPSHYLASAMPRKPSFPLPFLDALKGAGGILKGVNSISGGAGVGPF